MARYVLLLAAAIAAKPQGYQYDANSGVNYKYDINNPQPFVYNYQYDPNAAPAFNLNADPLALTDATIAQTSAVASKIAESLKMFSDNKLFKKLIESSEESSDPCSGLATNLDSTVTNLVDGVAGSRNELASIIASVQKMQANRRNPSAAIRSVSEALVSVEPLLPRFASLLTFNSECQESMDAVAKKYNTVAGGQTSKALEKLAANLGRNNFDNLCGENANLPRDVFVGMADILDGLKEIVETFEGSAQDTREIASTAALLKDGADIVEELDVSALTSLVTSGEGCSTSIPEVAKALNELADVTDVIASPAARSTYTYNHQQQYNNYQRQYTY